MATTTHKYPTLGESISSGDHSDEAWSNPTNIYSDDGNTASITGPQFDNGDQTELLVASGFDFSEIPDGATIDGVECKVNTWYANNGASVDLLQLLNTSKTPVGTNQCSTPVALTLDDTTIITKGSSSDLWGNELTAAWVKNSNFGVAIGMIATANNADVFVDYVTLSVTYTTTATEVDATCETLTLTQYATDINAEIDIDADVEALTLTEYNADINARIDVAADIESLTLTEYGVDINAEIEINASCDNLTLTEHNCTVDTGLGVEVSADVESLTLTEYGVDINAEVEVSAGKDTLTLTEYQVDVNVAIGVDCETALWTLTEYAAVVALNVEVIAAQEELTLTEYSADVIFDVKIDAAIESLTLTEYRANVDTGAPKGGKCQKGQLLGVY